MTGIKVILLGSVTGLAALPMAAETAQMPSWETLGVAGVLGVVAIWSTRALVKVYLMQHEDLKGVIQENTKAMVEVRDAIRECKKK